MDCSRERSRECPRCGNPLAPGVGCCPYCGESLGAVATGKAGKAPPDFRFRQINIKAGMPLADEALRRLDVSLDAARAQGVRVLFVVHGYGSSGKGGVIRDQCRDHLEALRGQGRIADFVCGEDLGKRRPQGKNLLKRFPQLDTYRDSQVANPGITVVVL